MPLTTFPNPNLDKRYFAPNKYGVPDDIYKAIVRTVELSGLSAIQLTDEADISTDASLGVNYYVTLEGNRNMAAPTNPQDWKLIRYYIVQDVVGTRTITWDAAFRFSTDIPSPTLTVTGYFSDYIEFVYNPTYSTWDCIRVVKGFDSTPL